MKSKIKLEAKSVFSIILLLAIVAIVIICFSSGISGNDFWWHIKVGEYINSNHSIPTTDIFSWIGMEKGISWTAHEWLSDLLFYCIYQATGSIGIFLLSILLAFTMTFFLWKEAKDHIKNNILIGGLFLALFAVLTSLFFYGRPHVFGFFLLFFELRILYHFYNNPTSKRIWLIPLLAVLWSNLHGGSSNLSYILCLLFLCIGVIKIKIGRIYSDRLNKKSILILGGVSIATIGAIFINPIGAKVFIYPYQSFGDTISMTIISEWQAPDAKLIGNLVLYFVPIALLTIGLIASEKRIALIDLGVMTLFLFLFFRSSRFIIMWYISAVFYGLKYMPECKVKAIKHNWEKIAVSVCAVLLLIPIGYGVKKTVDTAKLSGLISTAMSDQAISAIKEDGPKRIFNDYNVGETLIYNDIPVFFDARADLFAQQNIMADGVSLMFLEQANPEKKTGYVDVNELIDDYKIDSIVILKARPLYSFIISHPEKYQLVFEDSEIAYFRVKGEI